MVAGADMLSLVVVLTTAVGLIQGETTPYCMPGMTCYPAFGTVADLANILDAGLEHSIKYPASPDYANITTMKDTYWTRFPQYVVMAQSTGDVQKAMLFARKYNLRVTIRSSGHDYLGRSTADGSFQIDLRNMKTIDVDLSSSLNPDGTVRVGSGNTWARVYEEIDKHGRVVIGGSAHTVAMGGYTLGGGHSPMSRSLGLAVDNLLAVTMVTTDGSLVNVSASGWTKVEPDGKTTTSTDGELFWALRGGGGGTFGVVTHFVFKLHKPPTSFGHVTCVFTYSLIIGRQKAQELIKFYFDLAKTLPSQWGGYFLTSFDYQHPSLLLENFVVSMLHYGPSSLPSFKTIQPLINYHPEDQGVKCFTQNYATFWEYEKTANDPLYFRASLVSAFVKPKDFDDDMATFIRDMTMSQHTNTSTAGCTNTLIGGKVSSVGNDDTAVSSNFRAALGSLSCGLTWDANPQHDKENMAKAAELEAKMQKLGHGVYPNEPPRTMHNWKRDFWGGHYARLLLVKKTWDPTNFLTCLYCVGYDLDRNYARQTTLPIIG